MNSLKYIFIIFFTLFLTTTYANSGSNKIAYIVTSEKIPFWSIMSRGINNSAKKLGYEVKIYDSKNSIKHELELTVQAIKDGVSGIIISPNNSSSCVMVLKLAANANIPVVISDVGTDSGEYVSYISSNNKDGAYAIGIVLANKMKELKINNKRVGIVAIPQNRLNGQQRTNGFMKAMEEFNIKGADLKQIQEWDEKETYNFVKSMITRYTNLGAIWIQTSNMYQGAIDAIKDSGKKDEVLLISFDAEPAFIDLIQKNVLVGSAMQQPFLMGEESMNTMHKHLIGKTVPKDIQVPILSVSIKNIKKILPIIRRNVLGIK